MVFLIRFFLVICIIFMQGSKTAQFFPKGGWKLPPMGSVVPQVSKNSQSPQMKPSKLPLPSVESARPKEKFFPTLFSPHKSDDSLFLRYMPHPKPHDPIRELPLEKSSEDALFDSPVPSQKPIFRSGDDSLFFHPLTKGSDPRAHLYDRYRITYYPWQREVEEHAEELKVGMRENPYVCSIYGGVGAGFGASSALFWNYLYKKGAEYGDRTPAIKESWPKTFAKLKKWSNSPNIRGGLVIKAAGKFCLVGIGLAVASQLNDQQDFSSTLTPTLKHIGDSIRSKLSRMKDATLNTILTVGNYLDYSSDNSAIHREK